MNVLALNFQTNGEYFINDNKCPYQPLSVTYCHYTYVFTVDSDMTAFKIITEIAECIDSKLDFVKAKVKNTLDWFKYDIRTLNNNVTFRSLDGCYVGTNFYYYRRVEYEFDKESFDEELIPNIPFFTDVKNVELGDKKPLDINMPIEELLALVTSECDKLGIEYNYKNHELEQKVEAIKKEDRKARGE